MALNENALKWVEALESGEYEQSQGKLCAGGGYCCLGVACDLAARAGLPITATLPPHADMAVWYVSTEDSTKSWSNYLPPVVMEWLGLNDMAGEYILPEGGTTCLAAHNDKGKSFKDIAAIIRSEPEGLFR